MVRYTPSPKPKIVLGKGMPRREIQQSVSRPRAPRTFDGTGARGQRNGGRNLEGVWRDKQNATIQQSSINTHIRVDGVVGAARGGGGRRRMGGTEGTAGRTVHRRGALRDPLSPFHRRRRWRSPGLGLLLPFL